MEYFVDHPPEDVARNAARQAVTLQKGVEAPAGTIPVVLGAGESGILLHEAVGHGLEADFNRKKTSNYSDRVGENVASDLCTVIDDSTIDHSASGSGWRQVSAARCCAAARRACRRTWAR